MAVRVRLTRVGSKKNAMWRVVVADQRSPRDGRFIEMIGHYNPQTEPSQIVIDRDRLDHWLQLGARPTETVQKLMRAENSPPVTAKASATPAEEAAGDAAVAEADADAEAAAPEPQPDAAATTDTEAAPETEAAAEGEAAAEAGADATAPEADAPKAGEESAPEEDSGGEARAETAGGGAAGDEESG